MRILSLGAGVQSTAIILASAEGILPKLDAAIFSDTGWEPKAVYEHLDKVEQQIATPAGIPIYRVSNGHIRNDALDPAKRFAAMPLFVRQPDGKKGMVRRQCTNEYKIRPILNQVKILLGAQMLDTGRLGRVPKGIQATQWIGISTDEFMRAKDSKVKYTKHEFPLLELGWSRDTCLDYLASRGWSSTPKSACLGCPFSTNQQWRKLRDESPAEWADAVAFDKAIRNGGARANATGNPLRGQMYLHQSCVPLDMADIDKKSRKELAEESKQNQLEMFDDEPVFTCSPFACSGDESAYGIELLQIGKGQ